MERRTRTRTTHRLLVLHRRRIHPARQLRSRPCRIHLNMRMIGMAARSTTIITDSREIRVPLPRHSLPRRCRGFRIARNVVSLLRAPALSRLSPWIRAMSPKSIRTKLKAFGARLKAFVAKLKAFGARSGAQSILRRRCIPRLPRFHPLILHGCRFSHCTTSVARHLWNW